MGTRYADRLLPWVKTRTTGAGGIFVYPLFLLCHRGQEKSPRHRAGALPCFPGLFREGFPGQRVEQLPEGRAEDKFCSTSEERDEKVFVTDFFGHVVDTDLTAYLFPLDEKREQRGLDEVDMAGQLSDFYIHVQALRKKVHIKLVMTVVLEKVYLIVGHGHFAIVILQTGFINDKTTITHHVFAEIGFFAFESAGDTEVRPNLSTFSHVLFGEVGGKGGFTSAGDAEI